MNVLNSNFIKILCFLQRSKVVKGLTLENKTYKIGRVQG